ncbi:hypothetical protein [Halomicrobium salinisoli]|uniref:hypothetical protein n=1 Tax=Halomicrobium salinisoli TaxID=2878391 RepID=UPI001CF07913|nr:hypothetical protein [Halomicrobium salinisoli]
MGRTNPTYRDFLDGYERRFGDFRRALRRQHQDDFDRLFARAREFADAAGYANHLDRDTLVLVSMLLAHEAALAERDREVETLREEVADLRSRVERAEDAVDTGPNDGVQ